MPKDSTFVIEWILESGPERGPERRKSLAMENFTYYTPTKVVFGRGTEEKTGALVRDEGCGKVLLHYGGGSAKKSGLLDRICRSLDAEGISYVALGGAVPNPRLSLVYEGIELCRREGVDFILAVGGGSVIDSAKAIGYGVADDGDVWDFYEGTRRPEKCLPVGVVLTIAAAGSEMSNSSVITNEEGWLKRGCSSDLCRPRFAVMNPELTMTLPKYQTACGCVDIMMHTMERYFNRSGSMELTEGLSEHLIRTVMKNAKILMEDPDNYEARAEVMWAGSLSHNGLMGCGTDGGDWASHQLEHELGGMFDVAHGAGLAAVWGSWARYVLDADPQLFARFAVRVMGVEPAGDDTATALKGIEAMEEFYRSIGMPVCVKDMGIELTEEQMRELAVKCTKFGKRTVGCIKKLDREDLYQIYRSAAGVGN